MNEVGSHNVREHLHLGSDAYDIAIRRFIPGYDRMLRAAAEYAASVNPDFVFDLGAGTGALSEAVLKCADGAVVELLDVDQEMLEQAKTRLAAFGERARFRLGSYFDPLPSCDAFVASLSLHHIGTIEEKSSLFERLFVSLGAGGVFVNADANMPADSDERTKLFRYWADHLVASGIDEDRAWRYFEEWAGEDTYLPLKSELTQLRRIGFEAERVWNDGPMGVVVAIKPGKT